MTDDTKNERVSIPKLRPKRQPPVIDATAKDVTARAEEPVAQEAPRPDEASEAKADRTARDSVEENARDKKPFEALRPARNFDIAAALPAIAVAAVCGVGAGLLGSWMFSANAPQTADTSAINNSIAQLSTRLAQQETKTVAPPDLSPLNDRSAKLETATGELRGEVAEVKKLLEAQANVPTAAEIAAVNRRLAQIEEKVGTLAAAPKQEPKSETQPAEIVALGALRDAVAAGVPFASELAAVRGLLKDRAAPLAPLDRFAKDGLPTVAALAKRFEPLASKLISPPPPADSGVFTRLWNNAGKLVEVRPVGEPQGSDTGAVVARMETKLARGDLAGALDEAKALSAAARELAKDWFAAAEQRRDAEASIKNLINAALATISSERPKQ